MTVSTDDNGLEVLSRAECLALLETVSVARIGVTSAALPVVLPVNVVLATLDPDRGPELVMRSVEGTKTLAAIAGAVVAVEADNVDAMSHSGWSVLVRGTSRVIDDPVELSKAEGLPLRPWASTAADRFIAVSTEIISGRRVVPWHHHDGGSPPPPVSL